MSAPHTDLTPAALTDPAMRGAVRVIGGAGTGKSTLLIQAAAAHIATGTDPESVLLLTGSARLGTQARAAITSALLEAGNRAVVREPLVRTVHSYAFAILRLAAQRKGDPPPRLITSAEQDGIIRELLAGNLEDGDSPRQAGGAPTAVAWPAQLRPALSTVGFATELRDLLARCTERGVDPVELQRIGQRADRPEWLAAGQFAQAYEQIMLLRSAVGMAAPQATVPALGAAELVGAALEALATDDDLLAAERARIKVLLVDDAQHLDPQAARLVRALAAGAELTVLAGDPSQSVFGYRGADPTLLRGEEPAVILTESRRCAPAVARAISGIAQRLPGADDTRRIDGVDGQAGSVAVRIAASSHAESALIADALRRAHLVDGVPWSQMAVIVRSVPRLGATLARTLATAGVPVDLPMPTAPLADQPAVQTLLTVLAATALGAPPPRRVGGELDGTQALSLLTGPIGRVDPVSLRQLRRALRRADGGQPPREFGELLIDALRREPRGLAPEQARPLKRVRAVLASAKRTAADGGDPRYTLWQAWHRSGLQRRWLAASERGGAAGAQADRDLDAVTALFDVAEQYVSRTPAASLRGLLDHVTALGLPSASRDDRPSSEAVGVLSAHAALGGEWEFVVIAGLQEGLWPNMIPRGGVLGTQRLVDVLDGVVTPNDRGVSTRAPLLAEERRLLIAAMGRARSRLLVTAVDSDCGDESMLPSSFCYELTSLATDPDPEPPVPVHAPRVLAPTALVGRLRAVVCAPPDEVEEGVRACAATQLARLAQAGISGADPAQWHAMTPLSTDEPMWCGDDHIVTLSPSTLQMLTDCPLRWLLERHGGSDARDVRSAIGSLLHALVADPGKTEGQMLDELEKVWEKLPFDADWHSDNELERHRTMLSSFAQWRAQSRHQLTEVGTEIDVAGEVGGQDGDGPGVRVRGRLDRLERDSEGRLVVVDIKTGKSPVTKDDAQRHAQLAMYQLAIAEGLLPHGDQPGGGLLVYLGKTSGGGATEREQDALTREGHAEWQGKVRTAAAATQGPEFVARINDGCAHCPVRAMCPAQAVAGGQR